MSFFQVAASSSVPVKKLETFAVSDQQTEEGIATASLCLFCSDSRFLHPLFTTFFVYSCSHRGECPLCEVAQLENEGQPEEVSAC